MSGIFISYRRGQAAGYAGRLADELSRRYGKDAIFRDIEAITAGFDFVEAIENAVNQCDAFIVVITPGWAEVADEQGRRRLENPEDFARIEVESALARNSWVIPVLVGGATMPTSDDLPDGIKGLARRQAHEIRDVSWEFNVDQLIKTLAANRVVPLPDHDSELASVTAGPETTAPDRPRGNTRKFAAFVGGGVLLVAAVMIVSNLLSSGSRNGGADDMGGTVVDNAANVVQPPTVETEGGEGGTPEQKTVKKVESPPISAQTEATREPVRQQRDPAAIYGPEIEAALDYAIQAEETAFRELDPYYFDGVYSDAALAMVLDHMDWLQSNGFHAAGRYYGREFLSLEVSPDGRLAQAEIIEEHSRELHAIWNDSCVQQTPRNNVRQTVYLSRSDRSQNWIIYRVEFHGVAPDAIPC